MNKMFKYFGVIIVVALLASNIYTLISMPKVRYIDFPKLFEGFSGRKELESKFETIKNQQKYVLDSLSINLKLLESQIGKDPSNTSYILKANNLKRIYEDFEKRNAALEEQFLSQSLAQINTYVRKYGKEKGYTVIFGANGNGSLMYADDKYEITEELLKYVNEEYNKK